MPTTRRVSSKPLLIVTAAEGEAAALLRGWKRGASRPRRVPAEWKALAISPRLHLVRTGVGKVNAASAVMQLAVPGRYRAVINVGIAGALPADAACRHFRLGIRDVVLATHSVYADEGVGLPRGFIDLSALGFPVGGGDDGRYGLKGPAIAGNPRLIARLRELLPKTTVEARIATVSLCSGVNAAAWAIAERTGAVAEAMEGAAIGHAVARQHRGRLPFAELRVISNTTGDRERQVWAIRDAFDRLAAIAAALTQLADQHR